MSATDENHTAKKVAPDQQYSRLEVLVPVIGAVFFALLLLPVIWFVNKVFAGGQAAWMYWAVPASIVIGGMFGAVGYALELFGGTPPRRFDRFKSAFQRTCVHFYTAGLLLIPLGLLIAAPLIAPSAPTSRPSPPGTEPFPEDDSWTDNEGTAERQAPAPGYDSIREGVEMCLNGELPYWVDPTMGQDFCDSVDAVEEDLGY